MQIATNLNSMICLETVPNENKLSHRWRGRKPGKTEARFVGRCELRRSPSELGKKLLRLLRSGTVVGYAKFFSRSHDAVIHVYDVSGLRRGKPISVTYVK
jgi:hypothetical protein